MMTAEGCGDDSSKAAMKEARRLLLRGAKIVFFWQTATVLGEMLAFQPQNDYLCGKDQLIVTPRWFLFGEYNWHKPKRL
ncbi:MAG: hypothetical protein J6I61_01295 [Prevotella sp.]|nr:hypothetical protein [Prevotella sp.]